MTDCLSLSVHARNNQCGVEACKCDLPLAANVVFDPILDGLTLILSRPHDHQLSQQPKDFPPVLLLDRQLEVECLPEPARDGLALMQLGG